MERHFAFSIRGLGKAYQISHQVNRGAGRHRYRTIQEEVVELARRWLSVGRIQARTDTFWALRDINLDVRPGEIVGIIGRNGAGKSTLLKILSRITDPTTGCADVYGRVGSLLEVGTGFHPELTGRENIFLNGAVLGMRRFEILRRFDEIVAFAEIEEFVDTPVKRYSSGMYMRLAFAVAAHLEPEILLVDEVLAVGDAAFQTKCLGKMEDVAKQGRTVLFVSHNLGAVRGLCSRAIVLCGGQVAFDGNASDAIYRYEKMMTEKPTVDGLHGVGILGARLVPDGGSSVITPRSPVVAELDLFTDYALPPCYVNLHVEDDYGRIVLHLRTDWDGLKPSFQAGAHRVQIKMPALHLRPGVYNAWFRLYANTANVSVMADSERLMVEVDGDQIGGLVDITHDWSWKQLDTAPAGDRN